MSKAVRNNILTSWWNTMLKICIKIFKQRNLFQIWKSKFILIKFLEVYFICILKKFVIGHKATKYSYQQHGSCNLWFWLCKNTQSFIKKPTLHLFKMLSSTWIDIRLYSIYNYDWYLVSRMCNFRNDLWITIFYWKFIDWSFNRSH